MNNNMEGEKMELKADIEANNVAGEYNVVFSDTKSPGDEGVKAFEEETSDDYCGLKKEELLKYGKDPYWVRLRIILLVLFCILWISMLVAAIVIIVLTPKCPPRPQQEWWETAVVYQVDVGAFQDSDGNGIGDLKGLMSKLDYIKSTLGVDAIDLSPIYKLGSKTDSNYTSISSDFGTSEDFIHLITAARKKNLKVILDFNFEKPNGDPKADKDILKRNDDILWHVLKLKVDGVRIVNGEGLTNDQMAHWKQLFENFTNQDTQTTQKHPKVLMEYVSNRSNEDLALLKTATNFVPINDALLNLDSACRAKCVSNLVNKWVNVIGQTSKISNWMLGNSKVSRIATRMEDASLKDKDRMLNAVNLLLLTLPGTAFAYYGDEIGMKNSTTSEHKLIPMQWDDQSTNNSSEPRNLSDENVEYQLAHGSGMSHLKVFKKYVSLRSEPSLKWGALHPGALKNVYFFVRKAEGHSNLVVAINFGPGPSAVNLRSGKMVSFIPKAKAKILTSTYNFEGKRIDSFADGVEIDLDDAILLHAGEGIILKWDDPKSWF